MVHFEMKQDRVGVFVDDKNIGEIGLYSNPFHTQNQYLMMDQIQLDASISAELFQKLYAAIGRPLQIMTYSDHRELVDFVVSGGFECMRKCYEVEASLSDYAGSSGALCAHEVLHTKKGKAEYDLCCRLMYEQYAKTHQGINPLTAGYEEFVSAFPDHVLYRKNGDLIIHLAFVEDNEIAYVYSRDDNSFASFAEALLNSLFREYQTICFEADDCDRTAMMLKSLLRNGQTISYDTFIYRKEM